MNNKLLSWYKEINNNFIIASRAYFLHQDRAIEEHEREHERERDQTHSYWYIPSAPRVNYSLLVMESTGMMKMDTGDDFPLRWSAETGFRLVFGGYRALRQRNFWSRLTPRVFEYLGIYRVKRGCGRPPRWAQPTWVRLGPQARPGGLCPPRGTPQVLLRPIGSPMVHKKFTKSFAVFGLRLIFIFCDVKNKQKTSTSTGHWVNRLVPKNDIRLL